MRTADGGDVGGGVDAAYTPVATVHTDRVNNDGTLTPIVNITAIADKFGVQFTFTLTEATWKADGAPAETALRAEWVNAICGRPDVQGFYTEQDQGPSQVLYNYAVITVGDDDSGVTGVVRVRMDQLNTPGAFAAIDAEHARVTALGTPSAV